MPKCRGATLEEATIDQLQDYMARGLLSSVQIALCYLERYWQTNGYIK
jgi:amidase